MSIYTLALKDGKYYVGKGDNVKNSWINHYPVIRVMETIENSVSEDEDKITIRYMNQYGIDNVRGGRFSNAILSKRECETIEEMLNITSITCYHCGGSDHFSKWCPLRRSIKCIKSGRKCNTNKECNCNLDNIK